MVGKRKGQIFMIPVAGVIVAGIVLIILIFGLVFLFKNIIWIGLTAGAMLILYQLAINKQLDSKIFLYVAMVVLLVFVFGSSMGFLAAGVANQQSGVELSVSSGDEYSFFSDESNLLAYGVDDNVLTESSKFSFTCMSPLADVVGCRLAPYTYRPVKIKVCNKDPELPLPPCVILVSVDTQTFRINQQIKLSEIKADDKIPQAGDVFITAGDKIYWWDETIAWFKGENTRLSKGGKYQLLYMTEPLMKGQCIEFGKNTKGEDTLFIVASKGAKINENHILQVALIETTGADKIVSWTENQIKNAGSWFSGVPIIGGVLGSASAAIVSTVLFPINGIASYFAVGEERTVFATGAYKFLVAYPFVEIFVLIGVIGVIGAAVSKLYMGKWFGVI